MFKQILIALLVITVALIADFTYQAASRVAGDTFNLQSSQLLFTLRPMLLITWYIFLVFVTYWFVTSQSLSKHLSVIFIAVGLIIIIVTAFPALGHAFGASIYGAFVTISTSRLALTAQSGAFLIALGVVHLLWPRFKAKA